MATYTIEESTLTGIADAIRAKNGSEDLYTSAEMAAAIEAIEVGTGGGSGECALPHIPEEAFVISGNCNRRFANNGWNWFLDEYGDRITTEGIAESTYMFSDCTEIESIPFDIKFDGSGYSDKQRMFANCYELESIGKIINMYPSNMSYIFYTCRKLRHLPEFENLNPGRIQTYTAASCSNMFAYCYSLRSIPEDFIKQFYGIWTSPTNSLCYGAFNSCFALDEVKGLNPQTGKITTNIFGSTFKDCNRLKDAVFAMKEDGSPYICNLSNQTMDFSSFVGYVQYYTNILNHNSGITRDTEVKDDATYQALKNNPDWWTTDIAYSRYNKTSALNTIASLPDVTQGSGNSIKFKGAAGSKTDGGAINTLTEEEIAVAASKGWTVSLV